MIFYCRIKVSSYGRMAIDDTFYFDMFAEDSVESVRAI